MLCVATAEFMDVTSENVLSDPKVADMLCDSFSPVHSSYNCCKRS